MINETYIDSFSDLPASTVTNTPETWQSSGDIQGYVNISGFRDELVIGNTTYIHGKPDPIIQDDAGHGTLRSRIVKDFRVHCYWCSFDYLSKHLDVFQSGNQTIARLNVTLVWHETVEGSGRSTTIYHSDTASFEDKTNTPETYPDIAQVPVNIIEYPDFNKVAIVANVTENSTHASQLTVEYNNDSISYYLDSYRVDQNQRGIYYVNEIKTGYWTPLNENLSRFQDVVILNVNVSEFDIKKLKVYISNIYESVPLTNYNISVVQENPEHVVFDPVLFVVIGALTVFSAGSIFLVKRAFKWR
jgi:hypothetical protein